MTYPEAENYDPNLREAMAPRAEESSIPWVCIYCGREWPEQVERHRLTAHLWECPKHPLAAAGDLLRRYLSARRPLNQEALDQVDADAHEFLKSVDQLTPRLRDMPLPKGGA